VGVGFQKKKEGLTVAGYGLGFQVIPESTEICPLCMGEIEIASDYIGATNPHDGSLLFLCHRRCFNLLKDFVDGITEVCENKELD